MLFRVFSGAGGRSNVIENENLMDEISRLHEIGRFILYMRRHVCSAPTDERSPSLLNVKQ